MATASSRELRRRSRARHPHFQVARGRGFDPESTLTAMDIEGVDVAAIFPLRSHHTTVLEVISAQGLRKKLGLKDGQDVEVLVDTS